jgi:tRNA modification GTPase
MAAASATIFAQASGAVRGAIAVIRVSGDDSFAILCALCGRVPPPRRAAVRSLRDADGLLLDRALVLWLPGPGSYTGEDSAELHIHGGPAVLRAVSTALVARGCRPAEPGEFSRRAFMNGRMDLVEAEGIADLVSAETDAQRRQALRQMAGAPSHQVAAWAERLLRLLAWQEALIDFPDEDLPADISAQLTTGIADLAAEIEAASRDSAKAARVRDGLVVAVIGAPNVGKSSLVNALAGRDVAIVAAAPGTTRDVVEVALELAGVPVTLIDTAGLRETDDPVEAEGVRRARARAAAADIVMHVCDASGGDEVLLAAQDPTAHMLRIANKVDLAAGPEGYLGVSAITGVGLADLRSALEAAAARLTIVGGGAAFSRTRHVAALAEAATALRAAEVSALPELCGEELRLAMRALGRITGTVGVEDVLDNVFGAFCIGK